MLDYNDIGQLICRTKNYNYIFKVPICGQPDRVGNSGLTYLIVSTFLISAYVFVFFFFLNRPIVD